MESYSRVIAYQLTQLEKEKRTSNNNNNNNNEDEDSLYKEMRSFLEQHLFNNELHFHSFMQWKSTTNNETITLAQNSSMSIEFPIAIVPNHIVRELVLSNSNDSCSRILYLSSYTIRKQNDKRSNELNTLYCYTHLLQNVLNHGLCIRENRVQYSKYHVLIFLKMNKSDLLLCKNTNMVIIEDHVPSSNHSFLYMKATIKITSDGSNKFYLQSLHTIDEKRFQFEIERGRIFKLENTSLAPPSLSISSLVPQSSHVRRYPKANHLDFIDV